MLLRLASFLLIFATTTVISYQIDNDVCQGTLDSLISHLNGSQLSQGAESSACACACAGSSAGNAWQQQPPPSIHIDMSSLLHDAVQREVTSQQDQIIFRLGAAQGQDRAKYYSRDNLKLVKLGTKNYFFSRKQQLSWTDAASFCRFHDMDLVSVETKEEDHLILQHLRSIVMGNESSGVFTSGNQIGGNGFHWATGQNVTYRNWAQGEPSNPNVEHCLIYYKYAWADFPCTSLAYFACEEHLPV